MTDNSITSPAELHRHLATVRERGVAVERQESNPDVSCVAAPVRGSAGKVGGGAAPPARRDPGACAGGGPPPPPRPPPRPAPRPAPPPPPRAARRRGEAAGGR